MYLVIKVMKCQLRFLKGRSQCLRSHPSVPENGLAAGKIKILGF